MLLVGGMNPGTKTHNIHQENEQTNRRDHWQIFLATMADDFFELTIQELDHEFQDVLDFPGLLHGERAANERKENAAEEENDYGKHDVIGNDLLGRNIGLAKPTIDCRTERMLQRGNNGSEDLVHLFGNQKTMFFHTTPLAGF